MVFVWFEDEELSNGVVEMIPVVAIGTFRSSIVDGRSFEDVQECRTCGAIARSPDYVARLLVIDERATVADVDSLDGHNCLVVNATVRALSDEERAVAVEAARIALLESRQKKKTEKK